MKHYIIPIFIPHYGCTHQCIFCNQRTITGREKPITASEVSLIIEEYLERVTEQRKIEVAFYGGSFTALPPQIQYKLLAPACHALRAGKIHAIRCSTRPDCIDGSNIDKLKQLGVSTIELGVQSLDDNVLTAANRGHVSDVVFDAVKIIKSLGIKCGIQLMIGLPGEDWPSLVNTAHRAIALNPDFVRIYPTLVLKDTLLADLYLNDDYHPLSLKQAAARAAGVKLMFEHNNIPVIRVGLQATEELSKSGTILAGPYHPAFGEMVDSYIFSLMVTRVIENISEPLLGLIIHHHPKDHSKLRGIACSNIAQWQSQYRVQTLKMIPDGKNIGELSLQVNNDVYVINKSMINCI